MRELLFSREYHQQEKNKLHKSYREFIDDLRLDFRNGFTTDAVDENFLEQLAEIIEDECFDRFSPLKFYWLNLVDNIVYLIQMHEELLGDEEVTTDELMKIEEELFSFWDNSDLAESFQQFLDDGSPVIEASNSLLPLIENQIISFYLLHFNQHSQTFDDALMYQTIPELGDSSKKIFIGDEHKSVYLSQDADTFPSLPIREISQEEKVLSIEVQDKICSLKIEAASPSQNIDDYKFCILSTEDQFHNETVVMVMAAIDLIKTSAPHILCALKGFTKTIVPHYNTDIDSYSLKYLPGQTILKCIDRSVLDLACDIVLENAHHFLNTVLYSEEFFIEEEEVFFDPWKIDLSPASEIYISTFGAFWVMELSYNLLKQDRLTTSEKEQVEVRFMTEHFRIERSRIEIESALKNKQLNKSSRELITTIFKRSFEYKSEAEILLESFKKKGSNHLKEIQVLLGHLAPMRS